ncbi:MAG: 1-(5-phosphoribosyl)-5-[(5-phosphoribosylamino)methylideneamino] imidazole-4-carboxamide isomerase, partial [Planctomycetota bacterium]
MPESRRGRLTIYPSIDLRGGEVVRLAQGDFERQTTYDRDPALLVRQWANLGAERLHVVDLDGAKAGAVQQAEAIEAIVRAEPRLKVQAGGGVREIDDVRRLLDAGCDRVVVGTRGVRDRAWLESILSDDDIAGRVVLAVDAKGGRVAVGGWQETTDVAVLDLAADVSALPLAALLYTDVARDGMMTGTDADGTQQLACATELPVLASGGVGKIDD